MKLREDVIGSISLGLGIVDGGSAALYISVPHLAIMIIRTLWMSLFVLCVYLYLRNSVKESRAEAVKAHAQRKRRIEEQWLNDYRQFRDEIHGKDKNE